MVNLGKIAVGDKNTDIQVLVEETSLSDINSVVNFSTTPATLLQIIIIDPDENESTHTATLLNAPGTDGIIHFVNSDDTLFDEKGLWGFKPKITFTAGSVLTGNPVYREVIG